MNQLRPFSPIGSGLRVHSSVEKSADQLSITFTFEGELDKIAIPAKASSPQQRDGLWKTTCLEIFFGLSNREEYWEINLSPSGDWNCYHFDRYREGMKRDLRLRLKVLSSNVGEKKAEWAAEIDLSQLNLDPILASSQIELSTTAVIENAAGTISFWAVHHAGAVPDFHLRKSFSSF